MLRFLHKINVAMDNQRNSYRCMYDNGVAPRICAVWLNFSHVINISESISLAEYPYFWCNAYHNFALFIPHPKFRPVKSAHKKANFFTESFSCAKIELWKKKKHKRCENVVRFLPEATLSKEKCSPFVPQRIFPHERI